MKENVLIDKSLQFVARILKLHRYLVKTKKKQLFLSKSFEAGQVLAQISMKPILDKAGRILFRKCTLH